MAYSTAEKRMLSPTFPTAQEDSVLFLWRAILLYSDEEFAGSLLWLIDHHELSGRVAAEALRRVRPSLLRRLAKRVATLLQSATSSKGGAASEHDASDEPDAASDQDTVIHRTWAELRALHPAMIHRTWAELLARYPSLFPWLRHRWRPRNRWQVPTEFEIAARLGVLLGTLKDGAERTGNPFQQPDSELLRKLDFFREMPRLWPGNVPTDQLPQWVEWLGDADCRKRFTACLLLRTIGVAALADLGRAVTRTDAKRLIGDILDDNRVIFAHSGHWLCVACLQRFANITFKGERSYFPGEEETPNINRYVACRSCQSTAYAIRAPRVICVLDRSLPTDTSFYVLGWNDFQIRCDWQVTTRLRDAVANKHAVFGVVPRSYRAQAAPSRPRPWHAHDGLEDVPATTSDLAVSWTAIRQPFDFAAVHLGDIDEREIERFVGVMSGAGQFAKPSSLKNMPIHIYRPEALSANAWNLAKRHFPRIIAPEPGRPVVEYLRPPLAAPNTA